MGKKERNKVKETNNKKINWLERLTTSKWQFDTDLFPTTYSSYWPAKRLYLSPNEPFTKVVKNIEMGKKKERKTTTATRPID